jgi:hypothetical protein
MFFHGGWPGDLPFRVERWDRGWKKRLETLATAADFLKAKAAFVAAVKR